MAEDNIDIEVTGFESLRAQIKAATIEMQKLAAAGKEGTEEYVKAAARVGILKDELGDAADTAAALGTAAGKFGAVTKALAVVAGGFTAIQGAIGLAGGDAKEFEKTMQKVQSAMALSTGLSQLSELGDAFKNVGKVAVGAFNSIKTAIGSTGIGLLVVGLGAAVAALALNWDTLKAALLGTADAAKLTDDEIKTLSADAGKNIAQVEILTAKVQDNTLSEKDRTAALKKLKEEYPNYFGNLGNDINDTKALTSAKDKLTEALLREAKTRVLGDKLAEVYGESIDEEIQLNEKLAEQNAELREFEEKQKAAARKGDANAFKVNIENKKINIAETQKELAAILKSRTDQAKSITNLINEENTAITKLGGPTKVEPAKAAKAVGGKTKEQIAAELEQEKQNKLIVAATLAALDNKTLAQQVEAADKAFAVKIAGLKKQGFTEVEIGKLRDAELEKVRTDYSAKEKEARDKAAADAIKDKETEYQQTKDLTDKYFNEEQEKAVKNGEDLNAIEVARLKKKIKDEEDYNHDASALKLQLADLQKKIDEEEDKRAEEKRVKRNEDLQASLNAASTLISSIASLEQNALAESLKNDKLSNKEKEKLAKESFDKQKKLQYALAVIDGAKTVTSILAQYPKFDGGIAMTAALIAAGITTGAALLKIKQTTFDSSPYQDKPATEKAGSGSTYAAGGILQGPSHDMGGIRTAMGELEGGEFVVNRRATMNFLPLLNQINASGQTPAAETTNQQQPIIKTYVVASEMSSQQEANAKLSALARL